MASASPCSCIPATNAWDKRSGFPWDRPATLFLSSLGNSFEGQRHALSDANAQGGQRELAAAFFQAVHRSQREPRARHAERMAERDGAAMPIDVLRIVGQPKLPQTG